MELSQRHSSTGRSTFAFIEDLLYVGPVYNRVDGLSLKAPAIELNLVTLKQYFPFEALQ